MLEAMEKDLHLSAEESDKKKIIEIFKLGKTIQLPVVENNKVVGILDLFVYLENRTRGLPVSALMEKDIVVAGENRNIFTFKNTKQQILPFIDEEGNFIGFVNKLFQKCYLPSREYMQVVEAAMEGISEDGELIDYDAVKGSFDAIIESSYDGIYITVEKGSTLSVNRKCQYVSDLTQNEVSVEQGNINISFDDKKSNGVNVIQNVQKRNEISVSDDVLPDGGIVRVINNIKDFDKIKQELQETKKLAEKYENELEFLRWAQAKPEYVIADSPEMKKVINLAMKVANVDSTVLIQGQSGVGKGILSKLIHNNSGRKDKPFIKIDCGSIPEHLLESELFGYEQGAFTGAEKGGKVGMVELAHTGTLFLDEIGELPLNLQMKLLRMIQDKEIIRIGAKETIPVDIRVIAATNRSLEQMVKENKFRQDLYYRLNVVPITIPPLRERREDVKPLIESCLSRFNRKYGFNMKIDPEALRVLMDYGWPGNVRELENIIEYLIVTSNTDTIFRENIPESIRGSGSSASKISLDNVSSLKEAVSLVEIELLMEAMGKARNTEEMGKLLKLDRSTVIRKMQKHNIKAEF